MIVLCTFCTKTIGNNYKNKINRTAKQNINITKQKFIPVSKIKTGEKTSKIHLTQRINMRQHALRQRNKRSMGNITHLNSMFQQ